jgi:hypothetical protein
MRKRLDKLPHVMLQRLEISDLLEPISKLLAEHGDAGELEKADFQIRTRAWPPACRSRN